MSIALAIALVGTMLVPPPAPAADTDDIVTRAREEAREGKFEIMVSSPKGQQGQRALMEAFQKRFDLELDWGWLPLTSAVSGPRIVEQARAGVPLPSAVGGYSYQRFNAYIAKNDLHMQVDWVGEFSSLFPTIKTAAWDGVLPQYRGSLVRQWDVLYVLVYNTSQVKREDLPKTYDELADPKWARRFGMSGNSPAPFESLALDRGVDGSIALVKKLLANQPRFKAGPPAVVGAVASGEIPIGAAGYTALAETLKAKGAPIDWVPLEAMPVVPLVDFVPKDAPQPNLGKLFLAWLVTEGLAIQEDEEHLSMYANAKSRTTQKVKTLNPNVRAIEVTSPADQAVVDKANAALMQLISGGAQR